MLSEFNLHGVFLAPLAVYALAALVPSIAIRAVLAWCGGMRLFWHVALFDLALYVCMLCLLVRYV
ncbi:DUF1656 domain-containing protein [Gluconacetobacter tumulicola]|uniref:DUF1656 domain-containing protein n=1 Tax=Gluconacetobacter tumulicola TaxID=1017177 RepID=A0A7W4JF57_9PROT|nr:DUF1656 domain-containing protein [Gluconacetobacter tumulicola]MBB2180033.1 DUF1656 domain-containing protein [Gluconacetobacter tumulicola]